MYGSAHKKSLAKLFCHSLFIKLLKCAAKMLDCLPVTEGMIAGHIYFQMILDNIQLCNRKRRSVLKRLFKCSLQK